MKKRNNAGIFSELANLKDELIMAQLCRRKSDGKIYVASYPEIGEGSPFGSMLAGRHFWFFREVELRGWWIFKAWVRTGEVWQCRDPELFDVVK